MNQAKTPIVWSSIDEVACDGGDFLGHGYCGQLSAVSRTVIHGSHRIPNYAMSSHASTPHLSQQTPAVSGPVPTTKVHKDQSYNLDSKQNQNLVGSCEVTMLNREIAWVDNFS